LVRNAPVVVRRGQLPVEANGFGVVGNSVVIIAFIRVDEATVFVCRGELPVEANGLRVIGNGIREFVLTDLD
jgi:hypothetical protein